MTNERARVNSNINFDPSMDESSLPKAHSSRFVVSSRSSDDCDEDCKSIRSLPLLNDDDYFYYHGATSDQNEEGEEIDYTNDDEQVDHVGELIGPLSPSSLKMPTKKKREKQQLRISLQSEESEMTCDDWGTDTDYLEDHMKRSDDICIEEFISLKVKVAELETQLQLQRRHDSPLKTMQGLQDRKLSLECENIGLKQKLQQVQEDNLGERLEACQVQNFMIEKISKLNKDMDWMSRMNEVLQAENRRLLRDQQSLHSNENSLSISFRRRSTTGDLESPHPKGNKNATKEVKYLPFPKRSRRQSIDNMPLRRYSRRPSLLLEELRSSFRSPSSGPPSVEFSETTTGTTTEVPSSNVSQAHDTWAATDEIIAQTELFNRKSNEKLLAKVKEDMRNNENNNHSSTKARSRSDGDAIPKRPNLSRSKSLLTSPDIITQSRPRLKRRKSFSLVGLRSSLCGMESDDDDFDVNSVLWDSDDEKDERTAATRR